MAGLSLSESQVEGVAYIEQTWWEHGAIPTIEKVADVVGVKPTTVNSWFKSPDFRQALTTRGISLDPKADNGILTIIQLSVANSVLNFHDKRSLREKLQEMGVSVQQYNAWLRTPGFSRYIAKRAEDMFKGSDHVAYGALMEAIQAKDTQALKLFFEMRGIHNPRIQVDVNVDVVLTRVVEIVSKHVKDPVILEAIAQDLERLDESGSMAPELVPQPLALAGVADSQMESELSIDLGI